MKQILGDNLHWAIGKNSHFGFHQFGNCWKWRVSVTKFKTCTFYEFWRFFISVSTLLMMFALCGCGNVPVSTFTTPAAVTGDVADTVRIGLDVYPAAAPDVVIARDVICGAARTNFNASVIVSDLQAIGITNSNSKLIIDGVLLVWNRVVPFLNSTNTQAYANALCQGISQALPQNAMARRAKMLPPHLN